MNENTNIIVLGALLVLLIIGIGGILAYNGGSNTDPYSGELNLEYDGEQYITVVVSEETAKPNKEKVLIHDRFVGSYDKDGSIVAISNGQAVNVRNGVVLSNDMLITANEEEYSVLRVNDYEKSVSSN